jgi:hypothetical protein
MSEEIYDDVALEHIAKDKFGINLEIRQVIAREIPISHTGEASVFLTTKKQMYVYIHAKSNLVLSDVKKIVARMGIKAELYVPPRGQTDYFNEIGRDKFRKVYPGRTNVTESDTRFYATLAPYNPALILVGEIKNGEIKQFDTDSSSGWRTAAKFAYRRIMTS